MTSTLCDQLQAIYDAHGRLTPALVVDEARDPDHPLHGRFEWDDDRAAEAWRREQAHDLIRSVKVVYRPATDAEPELAVRAFHAVRADQGHIYEPAGKVQSDPFLRELVLRDMEREWRALYDRYKSFETFLSLVRQTVSTAA